MKPYYKDSAVTIYHGDCRDVIPTLHPVDLLLTDPPYGVNIGNHAGSKDTRLGVLTKGRYHSYEDTEDNFRDIIAPVIKCCIDAWGRAMVFSVPPAMWYLPPPRAIGGIFLPHSVGRNSWGFSSFCHCLLYGAAPDNHKGCRPTGIVNYCSAEKNGHPTPKPIRWMTWAVAMGSRKGEMIFDPFMGSGTTLRAAKDLGRKAIGIEIEERYCEIAAKRMAQEVFDFSGTAYQEKDVLTRQLV